MELELTQLMAGRGCGMSAFGRGWWLLLRQLKVIQSGARLRLRLGALFRLRLPDHPVP
jgi:hypothetical protein